MKAKAKPQTMFGVTRTDGRSHWIGGWSVQNYANEVREEVGKVYNADDPDAGWKAAKKDGLRVVKLAVRVVG